MVTQLLNKDHTFYHLLKYLVLFCLEVKEEPLHRDIPTNRDYKRRGFFKSPKTLSSYKIIGE